jgi:hypothetical protein
MARQPAGKQENGIDADHVAGAGEARRKSLGGERHPPQPVPVERHRGALLAGSRLDLDEGKRAATPRDEVDFAAGDAGAMGEDPPAVQAKPPGRQPLGTAAAALGDGPPVQRPSSSARA